MRMTWSELLFAHWPVAAHVVARRLPRGLELDTFDGRAWLGVVPFRMSDVALRGLPALPGASQFPELNVRTYVTCGDKHGVWFFSLDAANALAVAAARRWFHLPYFRARMSCTAQGDSVEYASERTHRGAPPARFRARYKPISSARTAERGTLEHWLVERYCLYAAAPNGRILRGEIDHAPWSLHDAQAEIQVDTMARASGFELPAVAPLLHFAAAQQVVAWSPCDAKE
jgi:uncharacterized protein YqjF (DUF2071 family)